MLSSVQSISARRWTKKPSVEPIEEAPAGPAIGPADMARLLNPQVPLGKRVSRAVTRFLIVFCIGVVTTLAWQSYGAREMIASSSPRLGWLAPPAAPAVQAVALAPDQEGLKAISFRLADVQQRVDQIAAQFVAGQEQATRDITKLHAAEQETLGNLFKLHAGMRTSRNSWRTSLRSMRPSRRPLQTSLTRSQRLRRGRLLPQCGSRRRRR
jgi:hypothetical protein